MTAALDTANKAIEAAAASVANARESLRTVAADVVCAPPAFRLRDIVITGQLDPVCTAVEEILQLRHDIDDHGLALTLLRGIRPDMDELAIERRIEYLLDLAGNVRDFAQGGALASYSDAIDKYQAALHNFAGGPR